jgi:phosphate transport system substrate-binding protein
MKKTKNTRAIGERQMKRNAIRGITTQFAIIGMVALLIIGLAGGYLYKASTEVIPELPAGANEDTAWRDDTITLSGSTTVFPIADACAIAFMNTYTGTTVTVASGGSGVGYAEQISGVTDIGMGSRPPKSTEVDSADAAGVDLRIIPVAVDAVCVVVNPSVASSLQLTLQEVGMIFSGTHTHWDEVDSSLPHEEIYVVIRADPKSGTRDTFETYCLDPWDYTNTDAAHAATGNPGCAAEIEATEYSVGYIGYGFITEDMTVCSLAEEAGSDYIAPTKTTAQAFTYPISRFIYFIVTDYPDSGSLADRFIDFVLSDDGQEIAETQGYVAMPDDFNY